MNWKLIIDRTIITFSFPLCSLSFAGQYRRWTPLLYMPGKPWDLRLIMLIYYLIIVGRKGSATEALSPDHIILALWLTHCHNVSFHTHGLNSLSIHYVGCGETLKANFTSKTLKLVSTLFKIRVVITILMLKCVALMNSFYIISWKDSFSSLTTLFFQLAGLSAKKKKNASSF